MFPSRERNKDNIVKECGTDVESFQFLLVFLSMCTSIFGNECESHSFQLMWSVEEMHVGHKISRRKMSNRLSNQRTVRLIMLALEKIN